MKKWIDCHAGSLGCFSCLIVGILNFCLIFLPLFFAIVNRDASYLWWWMSLVIEFIIPIVIGIVILYKEEKADKDNSK